MSKAENYIREQTKRCSEGIRPFEDWLTPDQARKAVEIAREEMMEQSVEWLTKHAIKYYINSKGFLGTDGLIKDYKLIMSMKNE
jgi:hypothetical protein